MTATIPSPLILCVGDSLTAGYQTPSAVHPSGQETPYGHVLQEYLGERFRVEVSGICGETTGEMVLRFRRAVLERCPQMVIILGGTNDLGWNADPSEIMRNLIKMYELARASSIVPVPVTVPSIRVDLGGENPDAVAWLAEHIQRRQRLNALIADYAESKNLRYVDLFTATAEPESLMLAEPYSNDGLHLTSSGYGLLGRLVYEQVFAADPAISGDASSNLSQP
ncbi:MAG TPA: GDSL-type esterase/lipase family protein [Nitrospira sp.]|nr:GDSL-type esterase/lipase family protein [Nitrospira sp.]